MIRAWGSEAVGDCQQKQEMIERQEAHIMQKKKLPQGAVLYPSGPLSFRISHEANDLNEKEMRLFAY